MSQETKAKILEQVGVIDVAENRNIIKNMRVSSIPCTMEQLIEESQILRACQQIRTLLEEKPDSDVCPNCGGFGTYPYRAGNGYIMESTCAVCDGTEKKEE